LRARRGRSRCGQPRRLAGRQAPRPRPQAPAPPLPVPPRGRPPPRRRRTADPAPTARRRPAARQQRADAVKPLKKELNLVDNKLGVLFAERDALEAASADDALDAEKRADTGRRLKTIAVQIEALEARWLALSTQLDDIAESVG
jgi:ATP-binding cassette subfamily F protein 3